MEVQNSLTHDFSNISKILRGVFLTKIASDRVIELISAQLSELEKEIG